MIRRHTLGLGILAALLFLGAWRFTVAMVEIQHAGWAAGLLPVSLGIISLIMIFYKWRTLASGHFAIACGIMGLSAATLWRLADPVTLHWAYALSIVPAMLGAGILIEIRHGCGWHFSRRQGVSLIVLGGLLCGALLLANPQDPTPLRSSVELNVFLPGLPNFRGLFQDLSSWFLSGLQRIAR